MPILLMRIIPETGWKVQAEIDNGQLKIEKFRRGWGRKLTIKNG